MKKIIAVLFLGIFLFAGIALAQEKKQAIYFYAPWCSHCQELENYLTGNGFYEKYEIIKLNIDEPSNKELLVKLYAVEGLNNKGIPVMLVGEQLLSGTGLIEVGLEKALEKNGSQTVAYLEILKTKEVAELRGVALPVLVSAALVDAINPCAFAVLILLMATVIAAKGKRQALWAGLLFALAIFVSYFAMGLGLYQAITYFNLPKIISLIVGVLAILLGLANLKDAFWYGKFFIMEVPLAWRPKMQQLIKHVTSPWGALGTGFLVSLFLLPCSSGPYIVIVGLLAERVAFAKTLSQLALYNLIFVAPMILITLGMHFFGLRPGKLEQFRQKNLKVLHAIGGTILLLMGIYLVSGWV